jgi:hypothetical protein
MIYIKVGLMKIFFNTDLYKNKKINFDYASVNNPDIADIVITASEPILIPLYSKVKF